MKTLLQLALAAVLCCASLPAAVAQALKPVAVVSIASVKENLADVAYITRTAGMADYGDTARFFASALSAGVDKERPLGMYVVPQNGEFHAIAFLPLEPNGLATIFNVHKEQLGEPKDAGNGIREVGNSRTVFVKEQGTWAFVAEDKGFLADLPQDPLTLLGDLPKKYNVAGKLMIQNVPIELRRMAIDQLKIGIERFLDSPAARQGSIDRDQARQLSDAYLGNLEKIFTDADELLVGLGIDEAAKHTVLDVGFSAKDGTSLAKSMAYQVDNRTNFAGLALPEASITMGLVNKISPEDLKQVGPAMNAGRAQWAKQIDDSPDIPADKREPIKAALGQLFDILQNSIESGKMDGGGSLVLLPKSVSFVVGGSVAEGAAVEKLLKSLADLGRDIPNFPEIKLNTGTVGELKVHKLISSIPERNADARELLGNPLEILVGVGPKRVIVAGGKGAPALLQRALDQSIQQPDMAVPPFALSIAVIPILKFYLSMDDNPDVSNLLSALEKAGNDRINIINRAEARSSITRVEIQDGVIKAAGEAAKRAGGRMNRNGF